ncbi:hypothetical protein LWF01_02135 [Saxibacter everestensis]|uniref:GNAT family N-acetyltransferase n=1 Tax=Saxibacter everestensis TaxID=2909229 RepID=A0ABY8QU89_9MICO|nr:hypothetical protein LWF01_02135 [Brevibacteriaceae bacterium ZFBP1038]
MIVDPGYHTRLLTPEKWDDFAALVEANNGVWGGCWCMGFHPEGFGKAPTPEGNRAAKQAHTTAGTVHQVLVYSGDECVGWCQFGTAAELPNIKNRKAYEREFEVAPTWRIGCIFTGSMHRGQGIARARGNADPKPFIWKVTAQDIITKVQRGRATLRAASVGCRTLVGER